MNCFYYLSKLCVALHVNDVKLMADQKVLITSKLMLNMILKYIFCSKVRNCLDDNVYLSLSLNVMPIIPQLFYCDVN